MELWMSGEIQLDVVDAHRKARTAILSAFKKALANKDYGPGLQELAFISIILPHDDPDYDEVGRYSKKKKEAEFRLKIDHTAFLAGKASDHIRLLSEAFHRGLLNMREMNIVEFDLDAFEIDFRDLLDRVLQDS